jgi:anti-sigma factor RsiW
MMGDHELTCQELVELVTNYLEGALDAAARQRFEEHMAGCSACKVYVEQMRQTIRLLGHVTENDLHPSARDTLLQAFRNWKQG